MSTSTVYPAHPGGFYIYICHTYTVCFLHVNQGRLIRNRHVILKTLLSCVQLGPSVCIFRKNWYHIMSSNTYQHNIKHGCIVYRIYWRSVKVFEYFTRVIQLYLQLRLLSLVFEYTWLFEINNLMRKWRVLRTDIYMHIQEYAYA